MKGGKNLDNQKASRRFHSSRLFSFLAILLFLEEKKKKTNQQTIVISFSTRVLIE
jgi:hypothetical protein